MASLYKNLVCLFSIRVGCPLFWALSKSKGITTFLGELIVFMRSSTIYLVIGPKLNVCPGPSGQNGVRLLKYMQNDIQNLNYMS